MSLIITIQCDSCPATIKDVPPGQMTQALGKAGWTAKDAKGRTCDYCPRCSDDAGCEPIGPIQ